MLQEELCPNIQLCQQPHSSLSARHETMMVSISRQLAPTNFLSNPPFPDTTCIRVINDFIGVGGPLRHVIEPSCCFGLGHCWVAHNYTLSILTSSKSLKMNQTDATSPLEITLCEYTSGTRHVEHGHGHARLFQHSQFALTTDCAVDVGFEVVVLVSESCREKVRMRM